MSDQSADISCSGTGLSTAFADAGPRAPSAATWSGLRGRPAPTEGGAVDGGLPTDGSVLIWGGTGSDRERLARVLHEQSPRREAPFVSVNCAALPGELLESEVFGYESGAFSGAHRRKPGKLEAAHGGTVFLEDIGAMPRSLQAKLLRVLRDGRPAPAPSGGGARVDVRLVVATGQDLGQLALTGRLDRDLYRQLQTASTHVPAAADARAASPSRPRAAGAPRPPTAPRSEARGRRADEGDGLKAIARRAALDAERAVLKAVLEQVRWNRLEASRRLKISYKTLRGKIRQYGLDS